MIGFGLVTGCAVVLSQMFLVQMSVPVQPALFGLAIGTSTSIALLLCRPWFGAGQLLGVGRAIIGGAVLTALTLLLSAVLSLPLIWKVFETLVFKMVIADFRLFAVIWAAAVGILHVLCRQRRREIASIFEAELPQPAPLHQFSVLSRLSLPATLAHQRSRWIGD